MWSGIRRVLPVIFVYLPAIVCGGCSIEPLLHQTASFGGETAGTRASAQVLFINNTPYRAVFTFAAYDDLDQNTFAADRDPGSRIFAFTDDDDGRNLDGDSFSEILTVECCRVFSVGGELMRQLIRENLPPDQIVDDALVPGVHFVDAETDDGALPVAEPLDLLLGLDFPCDSMIVFRFEINEVGDAGFRVDYEVIPSRGD